VFTVLGASGFIGRHLCRCLENGGHLVQRVGRVDATPEDLGHAIYCIGVTADFRSKPFETIDAHVNVLTSLLRSARFESFLFLSSTRVYSRGTSASEDAVLAVLPQDPSDLYNASKILGEAACLALSRPEVRVARVSNVYGSDVASENFLSSIVRDAITLRAIRLETALDSEKDYISIEDVAESLVAIALHGKHRVYNLGGGKNLAHRAICDALSVLTGCVVTVNPAARRVTFPRIDVDRMKAEFGFAPRQLLNDLEGLVGQFRKDLGEQ
jgi:nucleoside-diphosphate-sugar epimerase